MTSDDGAPVLHREDLGTSTFWQDAPAERRERQQQWQDNLGARAGTVLGAQVFVSELAAVFADRLALGDRSYLSAYTTLWGEVTMGSDCTLNSYAEIRGQVRIGDGVRIGPHSSILGFNHQVLPDKPIREQELVSVGVVLGDDVWVGAHAVVLDGVTVGDHSIVAAGAIVTKDVAPWTIVAGNPARPIGDRRDRGRSPDVGGKGRGSADAARGRWLDRARHVVDDARDQLPTILGRAWERGDGAFTDHPLAAPTVRAWCDAVELAATLGTWSALPVAPEDVADRLGSLQDAETGLVPAWGTTTPRWSREGHDSVNYHVLSVGYALQLLGSSFRHPIRVPELAGERIVAELDALPWVAEGWPAGSWVDAAATSMFWNRELFGEQPALATLFGWLTTRCNPVTGLWGALAPGGDHLQPVNGFYRITRGTYAAFGIPLPYPERTIDSVLAHAADARYFGSDRGTACNVLDVIHPLWLARAQSGHRRRDAEGWAHQQLERICLAWQPDAGLSFALQPGPGWQRQPGLLGTEMWLSIMWLLCDYLGWGDALEMRPGGIHRPGPAARLETLG